MGTKDGSFIATIITTHMPRNDAAAPGHVCPGIRIHAIDTVQPPGIGIPSIADMDLHQTIVTAALAAKISAQAPRNACAERRSEAMRREISIPTVAAMTTTPSLRREQLRGDVRLCVAPSEGGFSSIGHRDPFRVRRGLGVVVVVPVPPLVRQRLRVAFRRVLPLLLPPERSDVEV